LRFCFNHPQVLKQIVNLLTTCFLVLALPVHDVQEHRALAANDIMSFGVVAGVLVCGMGGRPTRPRYPSHSAKYRPAAHVFRRTTLQEVKKHRCAD
jgi:hypothetical protein